MNTENESTQWTNWISPSWELPLTTGHIPASELPARIRNFGDGPGFYSVFDLEKRDTFRGYQGLLRLALGEVYFDFDKEGDLVAPLRDAHAFSEWLGVQNIRSYFSGKKGFGVAVPKAYLGLPEVSADLSDILKALAVHIKETYPTLDLSVYDKAQHMRVPGSFHNDPKYPFFKTPLTREQFQMWSIDDIRELARTKPDMTSFEPTGNHGLSPLPCLVEALEKSGWKQGSGPRARTSYRFTRENTDPGPEPYRIFESYEKKLCIKALFEKRCEPGGRHDTSVLLIVDMYRTGVHLEDAKDKLYKWAERNGLVAEGRWEKETLSLLTKIYREGPGDYSYGCKNPLKASNCSGKCGVYGRLSPENRPDVIDVPARLLKNANKENEKTEQDVADEVLAKVANKLLRQDRSLFSYTGTHWKELFSAEIDAIKNEINRHYGLEADSKKVDSTFKTLFRNVPQVPEGVNLFNPLPTAANFKNGTLHAVKNTDRTWRLEFRPHNPGDYVTNTLPFDYVEGDVSVNPEFDAMLDRVFEADPDKAEKIHALAQMYGACLMPIYPHFWFLYGAKGTGKSTAIKLALRLVSKENACSVDPTEFHGFNMETMVGKLVNFDADVETNIPIRDAKLKKIEDGIPARIRRKGIADAYGVLPATHLFGGNKIPPTLDGASRAHDRRWTFIGFHKKLTEQGEQDKEFADVVMSAGAQAVLQFAVRGLRDTLARRGIYLNPTSGKARMDEWQTENDPVGMFLEDIKEGEVLDSKVRVSLSHEGSVQSRVLFGVFKMWSDRVGVDVRGWSNRKLFSELRDRGFKKYKGKEGQLFKGFYLEGTVPGENTPDY